MTRWLVTGAGGQLGNALRRALAGLPHDTVLAPTHAQLDISDSTAVRWFVEHARPDVIVNAAAWTDIDAAEHASASAYAVNARGVAHLADAATRTGARLLHVSTSDVLAGTSARPADIGDRPTPRDVHGRSKLAGERIALDAGADVVRTAWLYSARGRGFVNAVLRDGLARRPVEAVVDRLGSPTSAADLANGLVELGRRRGGGRLLHFANTGSVSRHELARECFLLAGLDPDSVVAATTPAPAAGSRRSAYSVLSTRSWVDGGLPIPRGWRAALADELADTLVAPWA